METKNLEQITNEFKEKVRGMKDKKDIGELAIDFNLLLENDYGEEDRTGSYLSDFGYEAWSTLFDNYVDEKSLPGFYKDVFSEYVRFNRCKDEFNKYGLETGLENSVKNDHRYIEAGKEIERKSEEFGLVGEELRTLQEKGINDYDVITKYREAQKEVCESETRLDNVGTEITKEYNSNGKMSGGYVCYDEREFKTDVSISKEDLWEIIGIAGNPEVSLTQIIKNPDIVDRGHFSRCMKEIPHEHYHHRLQGFYLNFGYAMPKLFVESERKFGESRDDWNVRVKGLRKIDERGCE